VLTEGIHSLPTNPLVSALVESTRRRFLSLGGSNSASSSEQQQQDNVVDPKTCDWCSTQDVDCFHCRKCWCNICETCRSEGKYADHSILCLNPPTALGKGITDNSPELAFPFYFTPFAATRAVKSFLSSKGLSNIEVMNPKPIVVPHFVQTVTAMILQKGREVEIRKYDVLIPPPHLRSRISREERRLWDSKEFELLGYAAQAYEMASEHMDSISSVCSVLVHGLKFPEALTRMDLAFATVTVNLIRYVAILVQCGICPTLKRLALVANLRGCKITERLHQRFNQSADEHQKSLLSRRLHGHLEIGSTYTQHTQSKETSASKSSVQMLQQADKIQSIIVKLLRKNARQQLKTGTNDISPFFANRGTFTKLRSAALSLMTLSRSADKKLAEEVHEGTRNIGISEETRKQILTTSNNISTAIEMLTNSLGRLSQISFTWFTLGLVFPVYSSNDEILRFTSLWSLDLSKRLSNALPYGSGSSPTNPVSQVIQELAPQIDQLRQQQLEVARNNRGSFVSNFSFFHSQMCNVLSQLIEVFLKSHSFSLVETIKCLSPFVDTASCSILDSFATAVPEELRHHFSLSNASAPEKNLPLYAKFESDFYDWLHEHPQNNRAEEFPNVVQFLRLEKISAFFQSSDSADDLSALEIIVSPSATVQQESFLYDEEAQSYAIAACRSLVAEDSPKLVRSSSYELEGPTRLAHIPYYQGCFYRTDQPDSKMYSYFVEGQTGDCIHDEVEPSTFSQIEKSFYKQLSSFNLFVAMNICLAVIASRAFPATL
jgi:hypothetical protein